MCILNVCATCCQRPALYRTPRNSRPRRDRKHSHCFACHRNIVNRLGLSTLKEVL